MIPPKPPNTCWEGCCWLLLPKPKNLVEVLGAGAEAGDGAAAGRASLVVDAGVSAAAGAGAAAAAGAAPPTPPVKAT